VETEYLYPLNINFVLARGLRPNLPETTIEKPIKELIRLKKKEKRKIFSILNKKIF
jgi:hypothetical protein